MENVQTRSNFQRYMEFHCIYYMMEVCTVVYPHSKNNFLHIRKYILLLLQVYNLLPSSDHCRKVRHRTGLCIQNRSRNNLLRTHKYILLILVEYKLPLN